MPQVLNYAGPGADAPKRGLYLFSLLCSAAPLIIGVGTLVLFALTGWRKLFGAGLITIFWGVPSVTVAGVCLTLYLRHARRTNSVPADLLTRQRKLGWLLLIANFPAALISVVLGLLLDILWVRIRTS